MTILSPSNLSEADARARANADGARNGSATGARSTREVPADALPVVTEHVRRSLPRYFPGFEGPFEIAAQTLPVSSCAIVKFMITGAGARTRGVMAKFGDRFAENDEALTESRHYREFNERYPDRPFACPWALDYLPDFGVLLTEEVNGPKLLHLIRNRHRLPRFWPDVRTSMLVARCAQWLRAFHDIEPHRDMRPLEDANLKSLRRYLQVLIDQSAIDAQTVERIHSATERVIASQVPCRFARQHGDFALSNILVDRGDRVVVLDVSNNQRAPVLRDVAYFATGIRMVARFAVVTGARLFPTYARNFIDAYLDGHDADRQPSIIALYELEALLRVIGRHRRWALPKKSKWTAGLMQRYAQRVYDRALDNLLTRLEQPHPEVAP
jgi:hypothetical protein